MKKFKIKKVGYEHPVSSLCFEKTGKNKNIERIIKKLGLKVGSDYSVIIEQNGKIMGFFRYNVNQKSIRAFGTWVHQSFRRRGLSSKMWFLALKKENKNVIYVTVVSKSGLAFVNFIKKNNNIKVVVNDKT